MQATPEQMRLAERIADDLLPDSKRGSALWNAAQLAALAAIIETSARCAKLARGLSGLEDASDVARRIQKGDHLNDPA